MMTREYPPEVYGGAGVHVTELVAQLRNLCTVDVHCMGAPRDGAFVHQPDPALKGANPALATLSADLVMANAAEAATVVHSHTWYTGLAGHLAALLYGIPHVLTAHSHDICSALSRVQQQRKRKPSLGALGMSRLEGRNVLLGPGVEPRGAVLWGSYTIVGSSARKPAVIACRIRALMATRKLSASPGVPAFALTIRSTWTFPSVTIPLSPCCSRNRSRMRRRVRRVLSARPIANEAEPK